MIWEDDDFAKKYATISASGSDPFESEKNELSLLGLMPNNVKTVLDFGCSGGHFADRLSKKYEVTGYDIAPAARNVAKNNFPNIKIINTVTGKYDCITLKLVLHILENPPELLEKLVNNLTDKGCFVISLPHPTYYAAKYNIDYERVGEFAYDTEFGELTDIQYWRPIKYWIELFAELDLVVTDVDEVIRDGHSLPNRFNARFEKAK